MKQALCLLLIIFSLRKVYGEATYPPCGGSGWVKYKDEKCFKLVNADNTVTNDVAEKTCNQERLETDLFIPTLVSIKSAVEQEFLTKFVFDTSGVVDNVWIGAKRKVDNNSQFVWNDGSDIAFTNWAKGSPSGRGDCVQMQSQFARLSHISQFYENAINGKWNDVPCNKKNLVLCQKLQIWSIAQLQQTLLDIRKNLTDSFTEVKNELDNLKQNPVPIGFIYAQFPGQPEPTNLWSEVEWKDVTSDYAGLFFRAEGGDAAPFGTLQSGNTPFRYIDSVAWVGPYIGARHINLPRSGWSDVIVSGGISTCCDNLKFHVSEIGGEVRPVNKAVRIWKRTN